MGKKLIGTAILTGVFGLYLGYCTICNISDYVGFGRITNGFATIGAATSANKKKVGLSMEEMLQKIETMVEERKGDNVAIFYDNERHNVDNFIELTKRARERSRQIGILNEAYVSGELKNPEELPKWMRIVFERSKGEPNMPDYMKRLLKDELARNVSVLYEANNDAISGDERVSGEKVSSENFALIDVLDTAAGKAWWSPFDMDYVPMVNAAAHGEFALYYFSMGYVDEGIEHLKKSKEILSKYDDDVDLGVVLSDFPAMNVGTLKGLVDSAVLEMEKLDKMPLEFKYTPGWWEQVQKFTESLGSTEVCLGKWAEDLQGKYSTRAWCNGLLGVVMLAISGIGLYFGREDY